MEFIGLCLDWYIKTDYKDVIVTFILCLYLLDLFDTNTIRGSGRKGVFYVGFMLDYEDWFFRQICRSSFIDFIGFIFFKNLIGVCR